MENIYDSEGNSIRIHKLYTDNSLKGTEFEFSSICFIESYKMRKAPLGEELVARYENGLFRTLNSAENLRLIGTKNAEGDVTFENIKTHSLKPHIQKEKMEEYGTTDLDEVLKANLSAQTHPEDWGPFGKHPNKHGGDPPHPNKKY